MQEKKNGGGENKKKVRMSFKGRKDELVLAGWEAVNITETTGGVFHWHLVALLGVAALPLAENTC